MPELNIVISTKKSKDGVWLMATMGSSSAVAIPMLPTNTAVQLSKLPDNKVAVPTGFSGRIYFFLTPDGSGIPTSSSAINTQLPIRYDWIELTNDGTATACANLTSVDQFGLALSLQTQDATGSKISSVGYKTNANTIIDILKNLAPEAVRNNGTGEFLRVSSPLHMPSAYPDLTAYLQLVSQQNTTINIVGNYDGSAVDNRPAQAFDYSCTFNFVPGNTLALTPAAHSQLQGTIEIPYSNLMNMIYACDGSFDVPGTTAGKYANGKEDTIGYNDAWSAVVRNFIVGFNVGFYAYKPAANNGYTYNCNNSWDWLPDFAYMNSSTDGKTGYYNPYAKIIYNASDSYGFPFSDFIGKPLVSLDGVATLQVSVLEDEEVNDDYAPPPPAGLSPVDFIDPQTGDPNESISIIFDCGVGQQNFFDGPLTFNGKQFATGYNCWWSGNPAPQKSVAGGCTVNYPPSCKKTICLYTFSISCKPFNVYVQTDATGQIINCVANGGLACTISASGNSLTISNVLAHIAP